MLLVGKTDFKVKRKDLLNLRNEFSHEIQFLPGFKSFTPPPATIRSSIGAVLETPAIG
jgi:hypothetical protein